MQMTTIDEFSELTTRAQYSVSPQEFAVLSNLSPSEKENLIQNAPAASQLSPSEFEEMQTNAKLYEKAPKSGKKRKQLASYYIT